MFLCLGIPTPSGAAVFGRNGVPPVVVGGFGLGGRFCPHLPAPAKIANSDNSAKTAVLTTLAADLQTIRSSPILVGIEQAAPQHINKRQGSLSGFQSSFSAAQYEEAMASVRKHKAGVNFLAQNLLFSPAPGVPLCQARIEGLGRLMF